MNKQVFIINGSGGVGKDTFVELVSRYVGCRNFSSVEEVKHFAEMMGWKGEKDDKSRKFLSDLKDILTEYNDRPFKFLETCVKRFNNDKVNEFCFLHIREPEEIERAKNEFNAKTVLVWNKNVSLINSNHADANVYDYTYDVLIDNSGTLEELEHEAERFVRFFIPKK